MMSWLRTLDIQLVVRQGLPRLFNSFPPKGGELNKGPVDNNPALV